MALSRFRKTPPPPAPPKINVWTGKPVGAPVKDEEPQGISSYRRGGTLAGGGMPGSGVQVPEALLRKYEEQA